MPSTPTPDEISSNILSNVVRAIGPLWERRLSESDRALVRACCADAATVALRALASPANREAHVQLLRDKAHIHAQLSNCVALGAGALADAFWDGFRATVNGAVAIAFAAL